MVVATFPNATSSWSVGSWVRLLDETASFSEWETVISTESHGGWETNIDCGPVIPAAHFGFWKGPNPGDYDYVEDGGLSFNVWTHIAAVVDGENLILSLYVNGVLTASTAVLQTITANNASLYVGRWALTQKVRGPMRGTWTTSSFTVVRSRRKKSQSSCSTPRRMWALSSAAHQKFFRPLGAGPTCFDGASPQTPRRLRGRASSDQTSCGRH